jgi:hypothetical protein
VGRDSDAGGLGCESEECGPVRLELPHANRGHDEQQAGDAEDLLHHREPHLPDDDPDGERRHGNPEQIVHAGDELDHQSEARDLGRDRHEVDEKRGDEIRERDPGAEPLPDDVEYRPARHRCDPARHLGVQDDANDSDHDDPSGLMPNRAPVSAFATRSPMSTKRPNAVRMPRKISSIRFIR